MEIAYRYCNSKIYILCRIIRSYIRNCLGVILIMILKSWKILKNIRKYLQIRNNMTEKLIKYKGMLF